MVQPLGQWCSPFVIGVTRFGLDRMVLPGWCLDWPSECRMACVAGLHKWCSWCMQSNHLVRAGQTSACACGALHAAGACAAMHAMHAVTTCARVSTRGTETHGAGWMSSPANQYKWCTGVREVVLYAWEHQTHTRMRERWEATSVCNPYAILGFYFQEVWEDVWQGSPI